MDGRQLLSYTAVKMVAERELGVTASSNDGEKAARHSRSPLQQKRMSLKDLVLPSASSGRGTLPCRLNTHKLKEIFTWQLLKTLAMGQGLSLLICGTAITCQYLVEKKVETPMLQSFMNYALLLLTYTTALSFRKGDGNILQILKTKWWKYLLVGISDVEANYAVVKAYQFTTLTSIQLLDCFVIPVLMVLSWIFLKTRYKLVHYVGVAVCLLGVGAMVGADLIAGRDQGSSSDILLGDGLVLISATLYAVSNVCQEYTVKNLGRVEFLGMIGLFGTIISGIQLSILESSALRQISWNWEIVLLFGAYTVCMFLLYSCMPVVVRLTSATAVNLSLLTADLFSLFCGLFLFHYTFSGLYIVSFVVITVGFITFNIVPTLSPAAQPEYEDEGSLNSSASRDAAVTQEGEGIESSFPQEPCEHTWVTEKNTKL